MDTTDVPVLTRHQQADILSVVQQNLRRYPLTNNIVSVSVWFPDIANAMLNSNTPANGYYVFQKSIQKYTMPDIIAKIKEIWDEELLPIEVVQAEGAYFYAIPLNDYNVTTMLPAEQHIPSLDDFIYL